MKAGKRSPPPSTDEGGDVAYARRPVSYLVERVIGRLLFERHRADPAWSVACGEETAALEVRAARDTTAAAPIWERLRTEIRSLMRTGDFDIDNRAWFSAWRARLPGHEWHDVPVTHVAKPEWYLFGARRKV